MMEKLSLREYFFVFIVSALKRNLADVLLYVHWEIFRKKKNCCFLVVFGNDTCIPEVDCVPII